MCYLTLTGYIRNKENDTLQGILYKIKNLNSEIQITILKIRLSSPSRKNLNFPRYQASNQRVDSKFYSR